MKLADVNEALSTNRPHYRFILSGGESIIGRISGVAPTNDLLVVFYDLHAPPDVLERRILISTEHIVAIVEL